MKNKNIKRKLLHDRQFPSREQISKHQNFDRLKGDYSIIRKLLLKKTILWSAGVITLAVASSLFLFTNRPIDNMTHPAEAPVVSETRTSCILPPLPGKDIAFTSYRISFKDGGIIEYPTGSRIIIPPSAFSKNDQSIISDSVLIRYREFHDAASIFLSGIPMNYDSAGISRTLESAGMIEIHAFDGDQEITVAPQKKINICLVSQNNESRFNLYELDTIQKNWIYKGKDQIQQFAVTEKQTAVLRSAKKQTPAVPVPEAFQPVLADPQKYSFKIAYDAEMFPELAAYENMLFEVTDTGFKPAYFKIHWDRISLQNGSKDGEYIVNLKKKDTTIHVNAIPVFDKENYARALTTFQEKHKNAAKMQAQKEAADQAKLDAVERDLSNYNRNQLMHAAAGVSFTSVRNFSIMQTGIFNSDFPLPPNPVVAMAKSFSVNDNTNAPLTYTTIFMMEKGKNTVFRFSKNEDLRFNPSARKLIWTVTQKNQIAFFNPSDFSKQTSAAKKVIVPLLAKNQDAALTEIKQFCN